MDPSSMNTSKWEDALPLQGCDFVKRLKYDKCTCVLHNARHHTVLGGGDTFTGVTTKHDVNAWKSFQ